jgi:uncharacterized protein YktB (UPF0637 family)
MNKIQQRQNCNSWEEAQKLSIENPAYNEYLPDIYRISIKLIGVQTRLSKDNILDKNIIQEAINQITNTGKRCPICGKHKPRDDFYKSKGRLSGYCKACVAELHKLKRRGK